MTLAASLNSLGFGSLRSYSSWTVRGNLASPCVGDLLNHSSDSAAHQIEVAASLPVCLGGEAVLMLLVNS